MNRENPIERGLSQIESMLTKIRAAGDSAHVTPQMIEGIKQIKAVIDDLQKINEKVFTKNKIDIEKLTQDYKKSSSLSPSEKKMIEKSEELKKGGKKLLKKYEEKVKASEGKESEEEKNRKEAVVKERRKLFKPLGGDKKWIPM